MRRKPRVSWHVCVDFGIDDKVRAWRRAAVSSSARSDGVGVDVGEDDGGATGRRLARWQDNAGSGSG
jgi:hypothetical protein